MPECLGWLAGIKIHKLLDAMTYEMGKEKKRNLHPMYVPK